MMKSPYPPTLEAPVHRFKLAGQSNGKEESQLTFDGVAWSIAGVQLYWK